MPISTNGRLPYGTGSMHIRSNYWWMVYRDVDGRRVQENTWTADQNLARRMLAERALKTAEARVEALRAVLDESPGQDRARAGARSREAGGGAQAAGRNRQADRTGEAR